MDRVRWVFRQEVGVVIIATKILSSVYRAKYNKVPMIELWGMYRVTITSTW